MPRFFGLGDRINRWLAGLYGAGDGTDSSTLEVEPRSRIPGLSEYELEYLKVLSRTPGKPVMMVPPDMLPTAWQIQD
jgi:hypothetical protein